jgi:hypothetical protein
MKRHFVCVVALLALASPQVPPDETIFSGGGPRFSSVAVVQRCVDRLALLKRRASKTAMNDGGRTARAASGHLQTP